MTRHDIADTYGENLLFIDPEKFDKCIIGIASRCGMEACVAYDIDLLVKVLVEDDGMTEEEAIEYIGFNIEGAYVGETTPILIQRV